MNRPATLERGSFHDESMNGGNQPTDMSMIHRRCYTLVVASLDRTRRKQRSTIDYCGHMSRQLKQPHDLAIIIQVILSWVNPGNYNPVTGLLYSITSPVMRPIQRVVPPVSGIDLSPLVAIIGEPNEDSSHGTLRH